MSRPVPDVATLSERILLHQPKAAPQAWAATALVLGEGPAGPSVLMIRRLARAGDPWSGDMALPGGKAPSWSAAQAKRPMSNWCWRLAHIAM